jgi:two-component system response regulator RegA
MLSAFSGTSSPPSEPTFTIPSLARVEWEHIQRVLGECHGNLSLAATVLKIHRRSLQRKLGKDPLPESHPF